MKITGSETGVAEDTLPSAAIEETESEMQIDKLVNRFPLWIEITLSLAITLVVVALISGEIMRRQLQADYSMTLQNTSETTFDLLSAAALEPVISEDIPQLRTITNEVGRLQADIHAIRIFNEEDVLLAGWSISNTNSNEKLVSFSKDMLFEEEKFGRIAIDWSTQRLNLEVEQQVDRLRYWILASLLVLTLITILLMHFFAVRPIGKIHRHLLSLTLGNHKSRVDIHSSRELSLLGSSVNDLATALGLQKRRESQLELARQELFEAKEMAEVTLHSIGDGVITTDVSGCVLTINSVSEKLTGWSNDEAKGKPIEAIFNLVDEISREPIANTIRNCLKTGKPGGISKNAVLISRAGNESAIYDSGSPICNRTGEIVGAVLVYHDITEARHMTRELEYQATHDSLTDLINRKEFARELYQFRQGVSRRNQEHCLLYIDLDQFKIVNDTCGHAAGDALLQQLAHIISKELRRGDIFGRLGGDEFGVVLNECSLEFASEIADNIRKTVGQFRFVWEEKNFSVGTSIGVVAINGESADSDMLLTQADEACYSAKELGRNRLHIFTEDDEHTRNRRGEISFIGRVDAALAEDRFVLFQQAILPLHDNNKEAGEHFEILIRMVEEDGKLIAPGGFIPAVERYGAMSKIDRWVISNTFEWFRKNPEKMSSLSLCSINLSANSLADDDLKNYIAELLDAPHIDAHKICFEITETAAVSNLSQALNFIHHLKKSGCLFALDDFGSGMSSFGYLKNLSVDLLKIDGMFVREIANDKISRAMVKSINEVGHVMGKRTIAEFVENDEILALLKEIGVDYAQGYGIAKPEPLIQV